jgi:anti-sigma factor RsiW
MTLLHPRADLSAYIDDALDPAAQAAVAGHLAACALCRAHVAQLRATAAFVRALPDPVPSRRLVPRLAPVPWLAPLRTLMTLASGAAVFLFIASALLANMTFLATTTSPTSLGAGRAASAPEPAAAQPVPTSSATPARVPATSPNFAFGPTASPLPDTVRSSAGVQTLDSAQKRADQPTAAPSGTAGAIALQGAERSLWLSATERSPLLNPWLWLALAILCGAIAIALHRRLRRSV